MNDTQDEQRLIAAAQSGDDAAMEAMLERYGPLARYLARRYFAPGSDRNDVQAEALIGLWKAVRDYRPEGGSFGSFAGLCIQRQLITTLKTAQRAKHQPLNKGISLSSPVGDGDDARELQALIPDAQGVDPEQTVRHQAFRDELADVITRALSNVECDVLRLYMTGLSYNEIGEKLGRHVKSVDNAMQRVKKKVLQRLRETESLRAFLMA